MFVGGGGHILRSFVWLILPQMPIPQAFLTNAELVSGVDRRGAPRPYATGDLVRCEILEMVPDSERMVIGMRGLHQPDVSASLAESAPQTAITFGLVTMDDFPAAYK